MRRIIKNILWLLVSLVLLCSILIIFFTSTTLGLKVLIRLSGSYFHLPVTTKDVQGRLRDEFQIGELNYQYNNMQIKIKNAHLSWRFVSLLHQEIPINQFKADSVELIQQDTLFIINNVALSALLKNDILTLNSFSFAYSNVKVLGKLNLKINYPYTFASRLKFNPNANNPVNAAGVLNSAGDINLINWTGDFNGLGTVSLQGSLSHLQQLEQIIKWRDLNWPLSPTQKLFSKEGRINISGSLPNLNVELSSKFNPTPQEQWSMNGTIKGTVPWDWNFNLNLMPSYPAAQPGSIDTSINFMGNLKKHDEGQLIVKIAPGHVQMPQGSQLTSLAFQEGLITTDLSPQGLKGVGTLRLDEGKQFKMNFRLPHFNLQQGITKKQKFSSKVLLTVHSFDFLSSLLPDIKNPQGSLIISLVANGTFNKPNIETQISLKKAQVELPQLGINLNPIDCTLNGKKEHWEGKASIGSGTQTLIINGQGLLTSSKTSEITVTGDNFPLLRTPEYQINVSPKLQIKYQQDLLRIMGIIQVPSAQVKIQSFSNSVSLSNDVIFQTKEKPYISPIHTQMDLQIEMGDKVELTAKGLHATLKGVVNLKQPPQSPMTATGELNVVEGEYKAYGQNLSIEQGELFFTGGAIENPGINIRASKNINTSSISSVDNNQLLDFNSSTIQDANLRGTITVGVEVSGRLIEPKIQLFSRPAILSQADILSMLILGRPASQANKAGGQLLLAAISSMNLGNNPQGTQLLGQLKQSLGVDFNVESNSNYNLLTNTVSDKTAFVVSKSISKRISLSYNVGLSQADPNVITLKYILNKFFSLQVNSSGTSNGIDILYTSSKK